MSRVAEVFSAVAEGNAAALETLVEQDPSVLDARNEQGDSLLLAAAYSGHKTISDALVRRGAAVDLFEGAALGIVDRVASFLSDQPDQVRAYSHDGWTALHLAAFFGRTEVACLLLDRGADVNARSRSERFAKNNTPLHAAAANRQTAVAETLIARGADVNARDGSGFTPLGLAANNRNDILMMVLFEHGARAS